jgi:hypothetical protein
MWTFRFPNSTIKKVIYLGDIMDLATRLAELQKRTIEHREVLLTEEAAKTALVMPFLQALGYDVFNPSEVVPEFVADVGTKKGEKVDYAICRQGKVTILVECKPSSAELNINHAAQLFRYFSVTDARLAVLTNGVIYQFYGDIEKPNKMDEKPFFTFTMDAIKLTDIRTLEKFARASFDIDKIIHETGNLKLQSLIGMMAKRVYDRRLTPAIKEHFGKLLANSIATFIRDLVTERLSSALSASAPKEPATEDIPGEETDAEIITTPEEISDFHIVQAIASKFVHPKRIILRDAKSYAAILLDDNNRKTLARLHFNGVTTKYFGTFSGKDEARHLISDLTDIYQFGDAIEARLKELDGSI